VPIVQINYIAGRTEAHKRAMVKKVTEAICETMEVTPDRVRIILTEMPADMYAIGGELIIDKQKK
jgi:4-oxalocrotonate tautomerase